MILAWSLAILSLAITLSCLAFSTLLLYLESERIKFNDTRKRVVLRDLGFSDTSLKKLVGFFHPYCNAGGGGERVLWTAIAVIQHAEPDIVSVVYSGDVGTTKDEIIGKVKARFDIALDPSSLHIVFLRSRKLVEADTWPRFTLLGQSIGSMYLACEAMAQLTPDLYIDTMGYPFTFGIVNMLFRIPIGAYVHYPMISTDMIARVRSRKGWHTNSDVISSSSILSRGKLLYYHLLLWFYAMQLRQASFLMVNSSWTKKHIDAILHYTNLPLDFFASWNTFLLSLVFPAKSFPSLKEAQIVYPPCDTHEMAKFPLEGRARVILSVAQFRPEKDHRTQLWSFHELLKKYPEYAEPRNEIKLVLLGGCRNDEDAARVVDLRNLASRLGIQDHTEFIVNAPYPDMLKWLSRASIGLSTMVDEHFGINIVEFMASGVIPVTHTSGGPLEDIVVPYDGQPTGYHAETPETFADALHAVLSLDRVEERALRKRARAWAVQRFSEEEFVKGWNASRWRDYIQ